MDRISSYMISQRALHAILGQQNSLAETQLQLATGKRAINPSDDPASAARVLDLNRAIATVQQYQSNANTAKGRLELEDSLLSGATDLLHRAGELAVQGNNDTLSPSDKKAIATEVRQLLDQMVSTANAKNSSGEYVFSGYQADTRPFSLEASGRYGYNGDMGQRRIQIAPDRQLADGDNGYDVFVDIETGTPGATDGKRSIFETLQQLATELESDNPVGRYISDLQLALDNVLETRGKVGARLNAIDRQLDVNADLELTLETRRSEEQDLDYLEAIARFERQKLALEAAQKSFAHIKDFSLFNYL